MSDRRVSTHAYPQPDDMVVATSRNDDWVFHRDSPVRTVTLTPVPGLQVFAAADEWPRLYRRWGNALRSADVEVGPTREQLVEAIKATGVMGDRPQLVEQDDAGTIADAVLALLGGAS